MWKKTAWAIVRTILACASVSVVMFALYYLSMGLNMGTEWIMTKIVWIKDFVEGNVFAVVIIVALMGVGMIAWDLLSSKVISGISKIRNRFSKKN